MYRSKETDRDEVLTLRTFVDCRKSNTGDDIAALVGGVFLAPLPVLAAVFLGVTSLFVLGPLALLSVILFPLLVHSTWHRLFAAPRNARLTKPGLILAGSHRLAVETTELDARPDSYVVSATCSEEGDPDHRFLLSFGPFTDRASAEDLERRLGSGEAR